MKPSRFDPNRPTVGSIYLDAQKNVDESLRIGDIAHEMTSSLVDDLNDTIKSNPYENRPFYITIYEKKDLQMKKAILRRLYTSVYRPWPEDDTVVFYTDPQKNETRFCWCLPHHSEMDNILLNPLLYDNELIEDIKAWKVLDLHRFGFRKSPMGDWIPNENWIDKPLEEPQTKILIPASALY